MSEWKIVTHTTIDKSFVVYKGGTDLTLYVDYDDVDHEEVDREVTQMVAILNKHEETSMDEYYRKMDEFQQKYEGKRVVLTTKHNPEGVGTTGRMEPAEDGLLMLIDHPIPAWCDNYEDTAKGELFFEYETDEFEVVGEDFPIHSGHHVAPRKR